MRSSPPSNTPSKAAHGAGGKNPEQADPRYEWLRRSRTLLVDAYWPPLYPRIEFDARVLVEAMEVLHADTVRFGAAGKYGLIQSAIMPRHPDLKGRDLLREATAALRPQGARVVAYVPVGHGLPRSLLLKDRPQWALRLDDGGVPAGILHFGGEPLAPVCPVGPYRSDILAFIREVVAQYDISGIYLDGPYYDWNMQQELDVCQCAACRERYRKHTGQELPANAALRRLASTAERDEVLRPFRDWVGEELLGLLRDINGIAKTKDLPLLFNAYAAGCRPPAYERKMIAEADGFLLESELGGLRGLGIGTYHGKIIWRYTQPHTGWPRLSTARREQANACAGYETILWGGAPIVSYAGRFHYGTAHAHPLAELLSFIEKAHPLMDKAEPLAHVGVISLRGIGDKEKDAQASLEGSYLALQHVGLPTGILPREALADACALDRHAVLFLPSLHDLTLQECAHLRAYVARGGGLIATGDSSLQGGAFLLEDVFGVQARSFTGEQNSRLEVLRYFGGSWDMYLRLRPDLRLGPSESPQPDGVLPLEELLPVQPQAGTEVLCEAVGGDGEKPLAAAVTVHAHGLGRCAYVAYPIERTYRQTGEEGLADLIGLLVRRVQPSPPPCQFQGSPAVRLMLYRKPGVRLLHLFNPSQDQELRVSAGFRMTGGRGPCVLRSLAMNSELKTSMEDGTVWLRNHPLRRYDGLWLQDS